MALSDLSRIPPREKRPDLTVDLSRWAEGVSMRFREPALADMVPSAQALQEMRVAFPEFTEELLRSFLVMGRCYIRTDDDPAAVSPARQIGGLARSNHEVYLHIASRFAEAYPASMGGYDAEGNA